MSKFSEAQARDITPERIITLPPAAFANDWPQKPTCEVAIGLRRLSQADSAAARAEAEREAVDFYHDIVDRPRRPDLETVLDVRNDALLCHLAGRACTDPNDVTRLYFRGQEDQTRVALTPEGVRRIGDEYRLWTAASGVARSRATDEEARKVGRAIAQGAVTLDDEARMLLAYLAESLRVDELVDLPGDEDGEPEDEEAYVLRAQ